MPAKSYTNAPEICLIMQILQSLKLQKPEKSEFFVSE